jgi:hypothetical protein
MDAVRVVKQYHETKWTDFDANVTKLPWGVRVGKQADLEKGPVHVLLRPGGFGAVPTRRVGIKQRIELTSLSPEQLCRSFLFLFVNVDRAGIE